VLAFASVSRRAVRSYVTRPSGRRRVVVAAAAACTDDDAAPRLASTTSVAV
jgi:hypothetical protein